MQVLQSSWYTVNGVHFLDISKNIKKRLIAVSRKQQGRGSIVLRHVRSVPHLGPNFSRHCAFSDGVNTGVLALLPERNNENIKK